MFVIISPLYWSITNLTTDIKAKNNSRCLLQSKFLGGKIKIKKIKAAKRLKLGGN